MLPKKLFSPEKCFKTKIPGSKTSKRTKAVANGVVWASDVSTIAKLLKKVETHEFFHSLQLARVMVLYRALCVELRCIIDRKIKSLKAS